MSIRIYLALVLLLASNLSWAEVTVFENVRLIDPASGTVSEPRSLSVRDGLIVDDPAADSVDRRIDTGGYLIPGLAEMHAHVPPTANSQQLNDVLTLFLAHGVTTIRGMLGEPGHLELRQQLASGEVIGPRLMTAGPSFNGNSVSSTAQAANMVRAQAEAGYDLLKLHPGLWPEVFDHIAETARSVGIDYSGHISVAVGLDRVLESGQGTIDHLDAYAQALVPESHALYGTDPGFFGINLVDGLDESMIAVLARRTAETGIANVPTQTLLENIYIGDVDMLMDRPSMRYVDKGTKTRWLEAIDQLRSGHSSEQRERFIDLRRQLISALNEAGARLLLGADAPQIMNVPGDAVHHELALYVQAGLSPAEALATGTINVAGYLEQSAYGCLRTGCVADLVLLEDNPLNEINHTRSILGVMRAGRWFDRAELDAMLDEIAGRAASRD